MFLVIFVLAVIVSMPIVAIVLVSVASHREDAAGLSADQRGDRSSWQQDGFWTFSPTFAGARRGGARQGPPARQDPGAPVREDLEDLEDSRVLVATSVWL